MKKTILKERNRSPFGTNTQILAVICICILLVTGCKKYIEVDGPPTSVNAKDIYAENATAAGVLTAIYAKMSSDFFVQDITSLSLLPELSADNLMLYDLTTRVYLSYFRNDLKPEDGTSYWYYLYTYIYYANAVIEGLTASHTLSPEVKQRCLGEAYFIRAFNYFYLVNLYGDLPLAVSTDFKVNAALSRSSTDKVYEQIVADLKLAKQYLDTRYVDATELNTTVERVRPNANAAAALLARVYLYHGQWELAETEAGTIIGQVDEYSLVGLNGVFLKNSLETIWALQPVRTNFNTEEGNLFIPSAGGLGVQNPFYISSSLLNSFEPGDERKSNWTAPIVQDGITYYYPYKYKVKSNSTVTEYTMVFRLAEQYLIRAEARAQLNNIPGAQSDLDTVRHRAGLGNTTASTKEDLLTAILHERRVEFFTEWGHRWLDLKRTGKVNEVMAAAAPSKGITWQPEMALYPIPLNDILTGINLTPNP